MVSNMKVKKKRIYNLLLIVLLIIMLTSIFLVLKSYIKDFRTKQYWKKISEMKSNTPLKYDNILKEYQFLYSINQDIIGWIKVNGTKIDYPVMQTKNNPEYYLTKNFDRENDNLGTPFVDYRCDVLPEQSLNVIIYGHYTNGDGAFRWLLNYAYENWYKEHKKIQFDTLKEKGIYEVVVAFYYDATEVEIKEVGEETTDVSYEFYNYIEYSNKKDFSEYINRLKKQSLYNTNVDIDGTDNLITLVCCAPKEYSGIFENGRFIVVAKKI